MTQPTTDHEPITNQEILAAADRIARDLVVYALANIRGLLGTDCIGETIDADRDRQRLDQQAYGIVYGRVWDLLGKAGAEYSRRDQVLAEAAELIRRQKVHGVHDPAAAYERWGGMRDAADLLIAARTTTAQEG